MMVLKFSWRYVAPPCNVTGRANFRQGRGPSACSRIGGQSYHIARVRVVVTGGHCQGFVRPSLPVP